MAATEAIIAGDDDGFNVPSNCCKHVLIIFLNILYCFIINGITIES